MSDVQSEVSLSEVEDLRRRTRRTASPSWLPFFVFGALCLGAVPFALPGDGYDGFYWLVAGPAGGALTWWLAQRRGTSLGILDRHIPLYAAIIAGMVFGATAIGWAGAGSDST